MDAERYTRYWSSVARDLEPDRGMSLADRLASLSASAQVLGGVMIMLNVLNILYLYPEFWVFTSRVWEIMLTPPDVVRQLYPELYDGSIIASSVMTTAHIMLQMLYSSVKRQQMPVFRGVWKIVYASSYAMTLLFSLVAFIVAKSPFSLVTVVMLAVSAPVAFSERYDRISEEVNRQLVRGGAR